MSDGRDMYVFRGGRRPLAAPSLARALIEALRGDGSVDALVRAGELECGLADAAAPSAPAMAAVTDAIADAVVGRGLGATERRRLADTVAALSLPATIDAAPAEGFAYYALHPRDFAALADTVPVSGEAVVVGIRTIGSTLAAIVAAALRRRGLPARRITVRPTGHPYLRTARFSPADQQAIAFAAPGAAFLVADEGPGNSGSSFLGVAEALVALGVPSGRIALLGSRAVDPAALVAPDAAARWRPFRSYTARGVRRPADDAVVWFGGGTWRARFWTDEAAWPAAWTDMERCKILSRCGRRLYKFEGLGRWGAEARERARLLAGAGFTPPGPLADGDEGFVAYPFVAGRPLSRRDLSPDVLAFLADYCAFRASAFAADGIDLTALGEMVALNGDLELGHRPALVLECVRPAIVDGRLLPHELVRAETTGGVHKTDAAAHGDDHFLPGPVDVAWDLAGAIVEWDLGPGESRAFLDRYQRRSGDDPRARLPAWLFAYALYRTAYWKMAAACMRGSPEEARLDAAYRRARQRLDRLPLTAGSLPPSRTERTSP